jgi:hypothetical protein
MVDEKVWMNRSREGLQCMFCTSCILKGRKEKLVLKLSAIEVEELGPCRVEVMGL